MNTVSDVMGNSGAPVTAEHPEWGTLYVARFDQNAKTKIEQHLKASARNEVNELRHEQTDAEYQLTMGAYLDRVAGADYKFGGRVFVSFMNSGSGASFIARMLVTRADGVPIPEMEFYKAISVEPTKTIINSAVKQAMAESFPKAPAPARAPGTSAPTTPLPL